MHECRAGTQSLNLARARHGVIWQGEAQRKALLELQQAERRIEDAELDKLRQRMCVAPPPPSPRARRHTRAASGRQSTLSTQHGIVLRPPPSRAASFPKARFTSTQTQTPTPPTVICRRHLRRSLKYSSATLDMERSQQHLARTRRFGEWQAVHARLVQQRAKERAAFDAETERRCETRLKVRRTARTKHKHAHTVARQGPGGTRCRCTSCVHCARAVRVRGY